MAPVSESPGGGNRYFADLAAALNEAGVSTQSLVLSNSSATQPGWTAVGRPGWPTWLRVLAFARAISRHARDADVLNSHFALYGVAASLTRRGRRLPLVVNFQGPWAEESVLAGRSGTFGARAKRALERYHYSRAAHLITLSQEFADLLVREYGVAAGRISVIRPGVDLQTFSPGDRAESRRRLGLPESAFVALTVRRLTERMGLETLLRAWQDIPGDALLLIAGQGSLRPRLEKLIVELGIEARVRLLGRVEDDDLPDLYRAADVSVVPSLRLEGFGLVVLESLACGTPVIASNTGGMAEVLPALSEDCLVPPDDVGALRARLIWETANRTRSETEPQACRRFAEQFSWTERAARLHALLALGASSATKPHHG